jgi:hypothetical protein
MANVPLILNPDKTKLSKLECVTLNDLRKLHTYERYGGHYEENGPMETERYLHSSKWGWIDMLHFSAAALDAFENGITKAL